MFWVCFILPYIYKYIITRKQPVKGFHGNYREPEGVCRLLIEKRGRELGSIWETTLSILLLFPRKTNEYYFLFSLGDNYRECVKANNSLKIAGKCIFTAELFDR